MVEIRPIREDSFIDAFNLRPTPGQDGFVSHAKPLGSPNRVPLTVNKANPFARKLYESRGFVATGWEDEDEDELALTLATHEALPQE